MKPPATAQDLRERAIRMREVALSFNDDISQTLIEMAEGLEAEAAALEAKDKPE